MNLHYDMSIIKILMLLIILKLGSDNNLNTVIHNNQIIKHITIIDTSFPVIERPNPIIPILIVLRPPYRKLN